MRFSGSGKYIKFQNSSSKTKSSFSGNGSYHNFINVTFDGDSPAAPGDESGGVSGITPGSGDRPGITSGSKVTKGFSSDDIVGDMQTFINGELKKNEFDEGSDAYVKKMEQLLKEQEKAMKQEERIKQLADATAGVGGYIQRRVVPKKRSPAAQRAYERTEQARLNRILDANIRARAALRRQQEAERQAAEARSLTQAFEQNSSNYMQFSDDPDKTREELTRALQKENKRRRRERRRRR